MSVRFLPTPEERPVSLREERENLAEVIELRTRLRRFDEAAAPKPGVAAGPAPVPEAPAPASVVRRDEVRAARIAHLAERIEEVPAAPRKLKVRSETQLVATEPEQPSAHDLAIKLLSRRALSSGELRKALVEAGHPELDIEEAVAECEQSLYLDDDALARSVVQKLRDSKGESRARIRQKLRERLLPDGSIDTALDELDEDEEFALLRQTAEDRARRLDGLDRQTAERRLLGFLARRGWSGERATRAAREAIDGLDLVDAPRAVTGRSARSGLSRSIGAGSSGAGSRAGSPSAGSGGPSVRFS